MQHQYKQLKCLSYQPALLHIAFSLFFRYPVVLSIENHCNIQQQKKIAQYLREIFGDKLDVGDVLTGDSKILPSPQSILGKILIKVRNQLANEIDVLIVLF